MNLQYIKVPLFLLFGFSVTLSSCLKDKAFDNGEIQSYYGSSTNVISLGIQVSSQTNFTTIAYNNSTNDTVVDLIPVELGGPNVATQDIHVTLVQADSLVTNHNNDPNSLVTDYIVPTAFTVVNPGSVVTIPKGSRTGFLQIQFKPSDFIGIDYALGYRVASVAESGYTISGNLYSGVVGIVIKNKFDGLYTLRQLTTGWAAYGIADGPPANQWPNNVGLFSTGGNSLVFNTSQEGSFQPAFTATGGTTGFGATEPQFTFDLTSNLLTSVVNLVPNDGRNRQFRINPAVMDSRYDPSTKTIYLAYIMSQNGRPDQFINDTLNYVGPR